ncbi:MAG: hypothetical protein PHE54_03605 [Bacilli bacterium]|nr:hypothetical protein [Bacilli bacterium]
MKALPYISKYITIYLILYLLKYIGIPSVLEMTLIVVPIINYVILKSVIFKKLEDDTKTDKKDIIKPFLITTTIFNLIFFYLVQYSYQFILIIIISNIIEFIIIKNQREVIYNETQKNIENYFKKKTK